MKDFLDRLAELLCYRKYPTFITSTALVEGESEMTSVVARNSTSRAQTWAEWDRDLLEYLLKVLERTAQQDE